MVDAYQAFNAVWESPEAHYLWAYARERLALDRVSRGLEPSSSFWRLEAIDHYRIALEQGWARGGPAARIVDLERREANSPFRRRLDAARLVSEGLDRIDAGDWRGAEAKFREASGRFSAYSWAYLNLGWILVRDGRMEEAIDAYRAGLDLMPHAEGYSELSRLSRGEQDYEAAVAAAREAVFVDPELAAAQQELGIGLILTGRFQEAESTLVEATRLDPSDGAAFHDLGLAREQLWRRDGERDRIKRAAATASYERALELNPTNETARRHLTELQAGGFLSDLDAARNAIGTGTVDRRPSSGGAGAAETPPARSTATAGASDERAREIAADLSRELAGPATDPASQLNSIATSSSEAPTARSTEEAARQAGLGFDTTGIRPDPGGVDPPRVGSASSVEPIAIPAELRSHPDLVALVRKRQGAIAELRAAQTEEEAVAARVQAAATPAQRAERQVELGRAQERADKAGQTVQFFTVTIRDKIPELQRQVRRRPNK